MIIPRSKKYRKTFKPTLADRAETRSLYPQYGIYGIKVLESGKVTEKQILSCINIVRKILKGKGSYWLMFRPQYQLTSKPNESRMGKGKGMPDVWVSKVQKGKILIEVTLLRKTSKSVVDLVFKRVKERLPLKVVLVKLRT